MKTALIIQHLAFEDLGTLENVLTEYGFKVHLVFAADLQLNEIDPLAADLWVILGGPIGVYEQANYPFLTTELTLLKSRLAQNKPTIGICLGAQLIAAALGAKVYPGNNGKEIGWHPLVAGPSANACPAIQHLLSPDLALLHWHGDTFDLPTGAKLLASSSQYPHQVFSLGTSILALQCHPEVTLSGLEHWYVGHCCELSHAGIDVQQLRMQSKTHCPRLQAAAIAFWHDWLDSIFSHTTNAESDPSLQVKGRFWLETKDGTLAGHGRIRLLELVHQKGSISAAAKAMHMSYKAAWDALDAINHRAPYPLLTTRIGGSSGGGSALTPYGLNIIDTFHQLEREHALFLEKQTKTMHSEFLISCELP